MEMKHPLMFGVAAILFFTFSFCFAFFHCLLCPSLMPSVRTKNIFHFLSKATSDVERLSARCLLCWQVSAGPFTVLWWSLSFVLPFYL